MRFLFFASKKMRARLLGGLLIIVTMLSNTVTVAAQAGQAVGEPNGYKECSVLRAIGANLVECAPKCDIQPSAAIAPAGSASAEAMTQALQALPRDKKIGSMLVAGILKKDGPDGAVELTRNYKLGGVFLGTGANDLFNKSATDAIKSAGQEPGKVHVPALIATDQEGGKVERLGSAGVIPSFPDAKTMGSKSAAEVQAMGKDMAQKMVSAVGITVDFAPVLDLDDGKNSIISKTNRAFSKSPDVVSEKGLAFAAGLREGGVLPVFKHFPGHGSADGDSHNQVVSTPPLDKLRAADLKPYEKVQAAGASGVMVGHLVVPGLTNGKQATISKPAIDLLRNDYTFDQVIFSDEIANMRAIVPAGASKAVVANAVSLAIQAGVDMPIFNKNAAFSSMGEQIGAIVAQVEKDITAGKISDDQINQSLARIAKLKSVNQGSAAAPAPGAPASPPAAAAPATPATPAPTASQPLAKGSKIYVIGDSLTVGMQTTGLQGKLEANGQWQVLKINAKGGEPVSWGIGQLKADKGLVDQADAVLVNLGTNNVGDAVTGNTVNPVGVSRVRGQMQQIVDVINPPGATKPKQIFWTDFYGTGTLTTKYGSFSLDAAYGALNPMLRSEVATNANHTGVIPWSTSEVAKKYVPKDDVHPNGHYPEMSDFIVNELNKTPQAPAAALPDAVAAGGCTCALPSASAPAGSTDGLSIEDTGDTNKNGVIIWNYFIGKGLTPTQTAGIMGNLKAESGFLPRRIQGSGVKLGDYPSNGVGFGLAQWTYTSRQAPLVELAKSRNKLPSHFGTQLDYLWNELQTGYKKSTYEPLKAITGSTPEDLHKATSLIMVRFEGPADQSETAQRNRTKLSQGVLEQFSGAAPGAVGGSNAQNCNPAAGPINVVKKITYTGRQFNATAIVLHWTAGNPNASVENFISAIASNTACGAGGCSVQFYVKGDGTVYQLVDPVNTYTTHALGANDFSIGFEIAGGSQGTVASAESELLGNQVQKQAVMGIVAQVMKQFNMPHVIDVAGKKGLLSHHILPPAGRKSDVGDKYHKEIFDGVGKLLANNTTTITDPTPSQCSSNVQLTGSGPGSLCDGLDGKYTAAQIKILESLRKNSVEPPLTEIVPIGKTRIHNSIYPQLSDMIAKAKDAGLNLEPVVGFRSFDGQVYERKLFCGNTFDDIYVTKGGCTPPVALPGQSEHQKGLAMDFGVNGVTNQCNFKDTPEYTWLKANASNWGFKPLGGSDCGGTGEPWHWSTTGR